MLVFFWGGVLALQFEECIVYQRGMFISVFFETMNVTLEMGTSYISATHVHVE
jgi:hypothetical protein